jgi:hypothetical protein
MALCFRCFPGYVYLNCIYTHLKIIFLLLITSKMPCHSGDHYHARIIRDDVIRKGEKNLVDAGCYVIV